MLRFATLAALLVALALAAPPPAGGEDLPPASRPGAPGADHDVLEARILLLTPAPGVARDEGLDLRLRNLIGDRAPAGDGRFLTVTAEPDPEKIVQALHALGEIAVIDRANLPLAGDGDRAHYQQSYMVPVPLVEHRGGGETFSRLEYREAGTKLEVTRVDETLMLSVQVSFVLDASGEVPTIASVSWVTQGVLPPGTTAVLRCQCRVPVLPSGPGGGGGVPVAAGSRTLIVLLTSSTLP